MTDAGSAAPDFTLRADRVLLASGLVPAQVTIANGKIIAVRPPDAATGGPVVQLAPDEVLLPGLVDTHVHVNEPGRTEWEGFATATAAAAAGGVTTIVDMPLNSLPPVTDAGALARKRAAAGPQCRVDVSFWAGAVPGNEGERAALHDAGAFGFKCFTVDSGVPEFPPLDAAGLDRAASQIADLGSLLIVHAEDPGCVSAARGREYAAFLQSRPDEAESRAVARVIDAARRTGAAVHILHVSSASVLPLIAAARADGVRITAETCPHYLALAAEDVPAGATQFKCCPPVRGRANRDLLWDGLRAGTLDCVVSDHSPCPPALKRLAEGDFGTAWGGIASLQLALSIVWTAGRERGCTLADVVGWLAAGPAAVAGLAAKGAIEAGRDADLVAFAPEATFTVEPGLLRFRHPLTPYEGRELTGVVRRTWLRGQCVYPDDPATVRASTVPAGRLLVSQGGAA